jgi:hypothetical protein
VASAPAPFAKASTGDRPAIDLPASVAGSVAAIVTAAAIFLGSRRLRTFDAALVGYATATIFLAFGVAYRYVTWVRSPPAMRYLRRGWRSFFSVRNFRRFPTLAPKAVVSNLTFQTFIARRGRGRWLAHQSVFWGVVLATLITFPLTFGWIAFEAAGSGSRYAIVVWGVSTVTFDPVSWLGWLIFHALDIAAVLVLLGCAFFLWRRFRDREPAAGQRFGYDFLPLVALVAISVTGLLLTLSSALLDGEGYEFLAIIHMATVVLTLVFIPFGKFFHVIQRPASVGVEVYKRTSIDRDGVVSCRRCGEPLEAAAFVEDLEATMGELGLRYGEWIETCPRCKRLARGQAYLREVNRGFG